MASTEKVTRRMLTTDQAAEYLGTTARHVRRLVSEHELSRYKVGGRNRFSDVELDAWLDDRRIDGADVSRGRSSAAGTER
jgi:excisionase family DNA binding protein